VIRERMKQNSSHTSWQEIAGRWRIPKRSRGFGKRTGKIYLFYLQQSFLRVKMALKIFQKKFPIDFATVIMKLMIKK